MDGWGKVHVLVPIGQIFPTKVISYSIPPSDSAYHRKRKIPFFGFDDFSNVEVESSSELEQLPHERVEAPSKVSANELTMKEKRKLRHKQLFDQFNNSGEIQVVQSLRKKPKTPRSRQPQHASEKKKRPNIEDLFTPETITPEPEPIEKSNVQSLRLLARTRSHSVRSKNQTKRMKTTTDREPPSEEKTDISQKPENASTPFLVKEKSEAPVESKKRRRSSSVHSKHRKQEIGIVEDQQTDDKQPQQEQQVQSQVATSPNATRENTVKKSPSITVKNLLQNEETNNNDDLKSSKKKHRIETTNKENGLEEIAISRNIETEHKPENLDQEKRINKTSNDELNEADKSPKAEEVAHNSYKAVEQINEEPVYKINIPRDRSQPGKQHTSSKRRYKELPPIDQNEANTTETPKTHQSSSFFSDFTPKTNGETPVEPAHRRRRSSSTKNPTPKVEEPKQIFHEEEEESKIEEIVEKPAPALTGKKQAKHHLGRHAQTLDPDDCASDSEPLDNNKRPKEPKSPLRKKIMDLLENQPRKRRQSADDLFLDILNESETGFLFN